MTYHMEQIRAFGERTLTERSMENENHFGNLASVPNVVAPPEKRIPFPLRLWESVNADESNGILSWTEDGGAFMVDEDRFEAEVMWRYPGLVQIPSFANFRRQLRVYNFRWHLIDGNQLVFFHPSFLRNRQELLKHISTKRKIADSKTQADGDNQVKALKSNCAGLDISPEGDLPTQYPTSTKPGDGGENLPQTTHTKRRYKRKVPQAATSRETVQPQEQYFLASNARQNEVQQPQHVANDILPSVSESLQCAQKYDLNPLNVAPSYGSQASWCLPLEPQGSSYIKHFGNGQIDHTLYTSPSMPPVVGPQCVNHCCCKCGVTWYSRPVQSHQFYGVPSYYKTSSAFPVQYPLYHQTPIYTTNYLDGTEQGGNSTVQMGSQVADHHTSLITEAADVQGEITVVSGESSDSHAATPMESIDTHDTNQVAPVSLACSTDQVHTVSVNGHEPAAMVAYNGSNQLTIETHLTGSAQAQDGNSSESDHDSETCNGLSTYAVL